MLTIFSAPKPFRGAVVSAQHNAIDSWRLVAPDVQVILFGDEEGIAQAAVSHGIEHVGTVARNEFGTPLLNDMFRLAQARARHPRVCYVNADIVFVGDLAAASSRVHLPRFLAVGRRTDLDLPERLNCTDPRWREQLRARADRHGRLHEASGIDYFIFPVGQMTSMPPFPVGRAIWDNWMIHNARSSDIPVVDLTPVMLAVHQNHDYAHVAGGAQTVERGAEVQRNWQLVGPDFYQLTIDDATWVLDSGGLHPARDRRRLLRRLLVYPALSPRLRRSVRVGRYLYRKLKGI
jgi:hypothetical protein